MPSTNISDSPEMSANGNPFGDILTQFEQTHRSRGETVEGTVMTVTADTVFVDIGRKMDGALPRDPEVNLKPGTKLLVSIRGRDEDGTYQLSTIRVETPRDWSALEAAFAEKKIIGGTVLEVVKGGVRVDVGVRVFMPASRSGVREQAEMEKLIGQQIECRITKLDTASEDVVVDRRSVLEERERAAKEEVFGTLREGAVVRGTVRTLMEFGAFVDLGGIDGLLHVSDMAYTRNVKPSDVVAVGDTVDVKILKIGKDSKKIFAGTEAVAPRSVVFGAGEISVRITRVKGKVARVADFGAFVDWSPESKG